MEDKKLIDFTKGDPARHILRFFWPLLMTSMLQQCYNFADVWIVGKGLGDDAFASVGNMSSLFFLIVGFSFGLANGFGVLIAQSFGAKDIGLLRHRLAGTIQLSVLIAVFLTAASTLFLRPALLLLNTDPALMSGCLTYGYIVFGGLAFSISYNVSAAVLRALGDSKTPLFAIILSSVINLMLDSFFIFILHTGVEGAAIATVASQVISASICIGRLRKIELVRLSRSDFSNEKKIYFELFGNGLPMALMNSITAVGCMVVQHNVNAYGIDHTTAYSACSKYLNLFMNPAATAGNAMSAYTSQNFGAGQYERIRSGLKVCLTVSFVTYLISAIAMVFFPHVLAGFLIRGDAPIALACQYLPICGITILAVNCLFVFRNGVQGMGHPIPPMWSGVLEMALRISVICLFMGRIGFRAAALAEVAAWTGALLVNMTAFFRILHEKLPRRQEKHRILSVRLRAL